MAIEIRKLENKDLLQLVSLMMQLGYQCTNSQLQSRAAVLLDSADNGLFVALDEQKSLVGYLHTKVFKSLHDQESVEVVALVVDETCRGKGVGKKLMEFAEAWALQAGVKICWLRSNVKREDAHKFYRSIGYQDKSISNKFEKVLA